ncbi:MAG: MerR family transcriptional regulator [Streptosporangiales bacterium]
MRIGELSRLTGTPTRMLRYYEERGLLQPDRDTNGHRSYPAAAVNRVRQIRGLLDCGLTSQLIATILPCLHDPDDLQTTAHCLPPQTLAQITAELDRLQQRVDCLTRNRDAIRAYLTSRPEERRSQPS